MARKVFLGTRRIWNIPLKRLLVLGSMWQIGASLASASLAISTITFHECNEDLNHLTVRVLFQGRQAFRDHSEDIEERKREGKERRVVTFLVVTVQALYNVELTQKRGGYALTSL